MRRGTDFKIDQSLSDPIIKGDTKPFEKSREFRRRSGST